MTPQLGALAVLATINLALAARLLMLVLGDAPASPPGPAWDAALPRSVAGLAGRPPVEAYAEISAHPAFSRSRAPFVPPPPAPPRPLPAPVMAPVIAADPGVLLGGVMIKGSTSKAYLSRKPGADAGAWVTESETYQGWQVTMISPSGVRLEQAGRTIELQLYPRD